MVSEGLDQLQSILHMLHAEDLKCSMNMDFILGILLQELYFYAKQAERSVISQVMRKPLTGEEIVASNSAVYPEILEIVSKFMKTQNPCHMMDAIGYYIFYGINWVITLLPLRVLYLFSDFLYLVLYYFPSYRRKVVATNLKNSFPEKSDEELKSIEKKFYRHLADVFIETV